MIKKQKYAVIRFLKQGNQYHIVHDSVNGSSIMDYAKEQLQLEKACLLGWIQGLAEALVKYYQCGQTEAYAHMNPYSVIVSETNEVFLLDAQAEENRIWLDKMQKKKVREIFVRKDHVLSRTTDIRDDLYGLGKTIQFIQEKCKCAGKYTSLEKRILWKISEISTRDDVIPKEGLTELEKLCIRLNREEGKKAGVEMQVAAVVIALLGIASCVLWESNRIKEQEVDNLQAKVKYANEQKLESEMKMQDLHMELGLLYWVELENEEEGMKNLEQAKSSYKEAERYIQMNEYLNKASLSKEEATKLWEVIEGMLDEMKLDAGYLEYIPMIRACEKIDTAQSWYQLKELCENIKENRAWGKVEDAEETRIEILKYLMQAYEKLGDKEAASEMRKELELLNGL